VVGFLHELLQRGDMQVDTAFSRQEMDRTSGETAAAFVELGIIRQPDADGGDTWRVDFDQLAAWSTRSLGARCGSGVIVASRVWFLGMLWHNGGVREIFLARGLSWRDGQNVIQKSSRLLAAICPVVLVLSEMPPVSFWQHCRPAVGSLRELSYLCGCQLLINNDMLFGLPRVPAAERPRQEESDSSSLPELEILLTQAELDILRAIAAEPHRCMSLADAMASGGYGKSATSRSLRRLREGGLIAKPPGTSRKGDVITAKGAAFMRGSRVNI
jgi:hypothetical protein